MKDRYTQLLEKAYFVGLTTAEIRELDDLILGQAGVENNSKLNEEYGRCAEEKNAIKDK